MVLRPQISTLYLRTYKQKKDGRMPLYIRFRRIDGVEPKFPLGLDLLSEEWDEEKQRILDSNRDIILQREVIRIRQEVCRYEMDGVELTKDMLREVVSHKQARAGKPENQSFYRFFDDCVSKRTKTGRIGQSTVMGYETTRRALKEFRAEIRIKDISAKLLSDFERFLIRRGQKSGKGDVEGSRFNRMKHIRTVIRHVENQKIPIDNPYRTGELAMPGDVINDVFLEQEELSRMFQLIGKIRTRSKFRRVLVMYLFACSTGLRLGDTLKLKWGDLILDSDPLVLGITMQKTGTQLYLPIFPLAEDMLLEAPEDFPNDVDREKCIFHQYSQEEINATLRRLAKRAKIDKYLTFHSSRRTFATLASAKGISLQDLKQYMGHSSSKTTERYIKWSKTLAGQSAKNANLFDLKELLKN